MDQRRRARRSWILAALILAALLYAVLMSLLGGFTGQRLIDGGLGVMLGLYVCSHPAANAIDLLFMDQRSQDAWLAGWPGAGWLALNGLALLVGWWAIFTGATRFAALAS
jgi:hypothetical protein